MSDPIADTLRLIAMVKPEVDFQSLRFNKDPIADFVPQSLWVKNLLRFTSFVS